MLLLLASCASQRSDRLRNHRNAITPDAPVAVPMSAPVVEEEAEEPEPVVSARPLVSQVHRAPQGTWQHKKQQALDSLCQSPLFETTQLGLYVYDLTEGAPIYAVNAAHRMRPASCQKLVTAITALHFLKGNYKLHTDFRIKGKVVSRVLEGDLVVIGGMDPMVTEEELLQAAASIRQQNGIDSIAGNIVYDLSMREDVAFGWGWCWDDDCGPLSALLVDGKDTFQEKWPKAMREAGIRTLNSPFKKENQKTSPLRGGLEGSLVYSIRHDIDELLLPMMKNSNNLYAECLFYQIAASTGKKGAGRKQASQRTNELLKHIGLNPEQYKVADGSGLSLYNYASAEMLVSLLGYAWRTQSIKEHLMTSLPTSGYDGTLQKRMVGTEAEGNVCAKTGTVTGISSLAGYITAANGHTLAFAIINQGVASSAIGRAFQDKVCLELCR